MTLSDKLKNKGLLEQVGGMAYLSDLIHQLSSTSNIQAYAQIIQEKALLRKVIKVSQEFAEKAQNESFSNLNQFMDFIEEKIFKLNEKKGGSDLMPVHSLMDGGLKKLESLFHNKQSCTGIPSGFHVLDDLTSGFQNSELIVLAARPSMGKTALGLNIALHNALNKKKVAFFSLEMAKEQLLFRLLSTLAKINLSRLINGHLEDSFWGQLITAASQLSATSLFIDDSSPLSPYEIRAKARRMKAKEGLDLLIVDYLQLMQLPEKTETREREVSEISRLLKTFSKELNLPIIAISQLNRGVESRSNRRPILSDLRESGAIEQDADLILMLYRDDYYEEESDSSGEAEVIVNKHRNGPTGVVKLRWVPEYSSFENKIPENLSEAPLPSAKPPY